MEKRVIGSALFVLLLFLIAPAPLSFAQADGAPISYGIYRTIHSRVLGEDRTLLIRLPDDYGKSTRKYPVLYKLDGERDVFLQASSVVTYLADRTDKVPDHIVVGIANTNRGRDMDPDQGAANFVQFIKTELVPFIDKNYRTSDFRILCGQSLSSVLTLYTFLKQPALFNGYVLSSFGLYKESWPSLFESELKAAAELKKAGRTYLFISNGKMDSYDPDGSITQRGTQFLDSLKQTAPANVMMNYKVYDEEGHVPFPSIYDGLRWIYAQQTPRF